MKTNELSQSYAQALFNLALDLKMVDEVDEDLRAISAAVADSVELRETLNDDAVDSEAKRAITAELFSGHIPEAVAVGTVVLDRGGVKALFDFQNAYSALVVDNRASATVDIDGEIIVGSPTAVEIITAHSLDEETRASIEKKLVKTLKTPVFLREKVDPKVIGGIKITIGDRVLDGTIASQLEAMREVLASTLQGGEA